MQHILEPHELRVVEKSETPQPRISLPFAQGERRKQARRQADRQGKYDRRKNRCANCLHYQENGADAVGNGFCRHHAIMVVAAAFACPFFEASSPGEPSR